MSLIYFAHPIDFVPEGYEAAFRNECELVRSMLTDAGHAVYDPGAAWSFGPTTPAHQRLQESNLKVLAQADVVFAYLPVGIPTIGAILEIVEATQLGIPAVVVVPRMSIALAGYHPDRVYQFTGLGSAVEGVPKIVEDHPRPEKVRLTLTAKPGGEIWTGGHLLGEHTIGWPDIQEPDGNTWSGAEIDDAVATSAYAVLDEGARLPVRAHDDDAGFDLFYSGSRTITVPAMGTADVPSDVAIEWPPNVWALLIGRSSTFRDRGLLVNPAVIDPGYRGKLFAIVRNIGPNSVKIEPGERIAQLVPLPALAPGIDIEKVDELTPSERGSNGLGSSGR